MNIERFWYGNETASIPAVWHYTAGVFSLLCLIFGIISNGLVILVFIRKNVLQRPRNYFLINLAITDLGLLLTNNSMHIISSFKRQWIFGQNGCNFYSVCGGVFGLASITTMASISLTRFAAVKDPFSSLKLTSRFTLNCLVFTWIYGSVWILPPLFGWNRFILEGFGTSCTFDYVSKDLKDRLFILILVTGGFLIPLLVILLSYIFILIKLSQRNRHFLVQNIDDKYLNQQMTTDNFNKLNLLNQNRGRCQTMTNLDYIDENNITRNNRRTEARATRTALLICAVFCLAWGPYTLMALISFFGFDYLVNAYTTAILGLFSKVAAVINPLVYALSLSGFREHILSYCKCIYQYPEKPHYHPTPSKFDLNRKNLLNLPNATPTSDRQRMSADRINRLNL